MLPMYPYKVAETLLAGLPKRAATVLEKRFGIGKNTRKHTLEAIGKTYGITRERVRQIEQDGITRIKKSQVHQDLGSVFIVIEDYIKRMGGLVSEESLVSYFDTDKKSANAIRFLLELIPGIHYRQENATFYPRWTIDNHLADRIQNILEATAKDVYLYKNTVPYEELVALLGRNGTTAGADAMSTAAVTSFLEVSKKLGKNYFGEWGHVSSARIRPRGVRDMAYIIFCHEGKPLHFLEAAERIRQAAFPRKVHAQTVHNELIKDARFVLVGRGTYGLAEWGYEPGTVRDIITRVLGEGSKQREEIVASVLGKRRVKENTILINLQNKRYFKREEDGRYTTII